MLQSLEPVITYNESFNQFKHYADQVVVYLHRVSCDDLITSRSQQVKPYGKTARFNLISLTDYQLLPDQVGIRSKMLRQIDQSVCSNECTKYYYNSTPIIMYEKRIKGEKLNG